MLTECYKDFKSVNREYSGTFGLGRGDLLPGLTLRTTIRRDGCGEEVRDQDRCRDDGCPGLPYDPGTLRGRSRLT